jgi:hypothetical protein
MKVFGLVAVALLGLAQASPTKVELDWRACIRDGMPHYILLCNTNYAQESSCDIADPVLHTFLHKTSSPSSSTNSANIISLLKSALGKYVGTPIRHFTSSMVKKLISSGTISLAVDNTTGSLFAHYNGSFTNPGFNISAFGNVSFPDQLNTTLVVPVNGTVLLPLNGTLLGNGTMLGNANGTLLGNGTLQGAGAFGLAGNGTLLSNSTLLPGINGTLSTNGTLLSNNGTLLSNNGTLLSSNGTLLNNGTELNDTGALEVSGSRRLKKPQGDHPAWPLRPGTIRRYLQRSYDNGT